MPATWAKLAYTSELHAAVTLGANPGLVLSTQELVLGTPSTLTVSTTNAVTGANHTHAITASANPGAAESILATDASGFVTVVKASAPTGLFDHIGERTGAHTVTFDNTVTLPASTLVPNGGSIGQAAGPLLTFDDTLNHLQITGTTIGIGVTPTQEAVTLLINSPYNYDNPLGIVKVKDSAGRWLAISGNSMWRGDTDSDGISWSINYFGYNGGATRFRDFEVFDGKGTRLLFADGSAGDIAVAQLTPNNIVMPDGGTIGQAAGPLLTFDDTLNHLQITGTTVGIGVTPTQEAVTLLINSSYNYDNPLGIVKIKDSAGRWQAFSGNGWWRGDTDLDGVGLAINWVGYNGGVTRFRDVEVFDGKKARLLFIDGHTGMVSVGATVPAYKLDVIGAGTAIMRASSTGATDSWTVLNAPTGQAVALYLAINDVNQIGLEMTVAGARWRVMSGGYPTIQWFDPSGRIGLGGNEAPTGRVHIAAGSATQYTAPLKFTSGTLLTTAEAGAMEFTTDDYFLTITTGAARKGIVLDDGTRLTATRVPFATTNGRLVDDADLTFATDTLSATKVAASGGVTTQAVDFTASTPDALAGDVNNWDLGNNTFIRASGGAADRIVTGIVARASGHLLIFQNIGTTNKITFANESASSTAGNRLINANAGSTEITPNHCIMYIYDATTARWREITHL